MSWPPSSLAWTQQSVLMSWVKQAVPLQWVWFAVGGFGKGSGDRLTVQVEVQGTAVAPVHRVGRSSAHV